MGYSEGGSDWLTSGATQTVTVNVDYAYDLSLVGAREPCEAYAKLYVAFWDGNSDMMLTGDSEWIFVEAGDNDYLVKTIDLTSAGASTGLVTGSESWDVDVADGALYSFWGQADAMAHTSPEPATTGLLVLAGLELLRRRR
jgi:MYXO-CTERM domain-containing protein